MQSFWAPNGLGKAEASRRQVKFERDCVRRVLRTFGMSDYEPDLIAQHKKGWNKAWLTFETFHEFFPTFPVILSAQSLYRTTAKDPMMRLSSWLREFDETFVWGRYCEVLGHYRAVCEGRAPGTELHPSLCGLPVGMPFNYDGITGGLILHNGEPLTKGFCPRIEYAVQTHPQKPPEPIRCWLEPFADWLACLAKRGWSPKREADPIEVEPARDLPGRERAVPLMPWAVRALDAGPASILLSWLHHAIRADPTTYPQATAFCSYRAGQRCVAASHADIGFVLRLSEKQVKTAVARLRKEGFIHAERGKTASGPKTMFTLDEDRCS